MATQRSYVQRFPVKDPSGCYSPDIPRRGSQGCDFTLDVSWIVDLLDRLQEKLGRVSDYIQKAKGIAQKILDKMGGFLDVLYKIPGVGSFAKDKIERIVNWLFSAADLIVRGLNKLAELAQQALAPWEVRSAGRSIVNQLVPKCESFAAEFEPGNLKSSSTWTGDAATSFLDAYARQGKAAQDTAQAAALFGQAVKRMGDDGVQTTKDLALDLAEHAAKIISQGVRLLSVPVGTVTAAIRIIDLVRNVVALIQAWQRHMRDVARQTADMAAATASVVAGGEWPKAVTTG